MLVGQLKYLPIIKQLENLEFSKKERGKIKTIKKKNKLEIFLRNDELNGTFYLVIQIFGCLLYL